jgi:periplasmic protein TonB
MSTDTRTNLFADSMLQVSWAQRSRRSWTTLTSFALEALAIGLLLLLPLWKTVGLPSSRTVSTPISLGRVAVESAPAAHVGIAASVALASSSAARFVAPGRIPKDIPMGTDAAPTDPVGEICRGVCSATNLPAGTTSDGNLFSLGGERPVMPALRPTIVRAFRTSTMLEGSLIRRVQPVYPPLAKIAHIQGPVVLFAVISRTGTIEDLRLVSGHPLLSKAAIDAVSQWLYRPYILNNEPIEVETQITVNFVLGN